MRSQEHQDMCDQLCATVKNPPLDPDPDKDGNRIALVTNAAAIERSILANKEIISELDSTTEQITDMCIKIIDDMGAVFKQKSENINELRNWRKTVAHEAGEIEMSVKRITSALSREKINELESFVSLIERLNKIDPNLVIKKIFDN